VIYNYYFPWLNVAFIGAFAFVFKLFVDQVVYTGGFVHPVNFLVRAAEEGKLKEYFAIVRKDYVKAVLTNWMFWVPVNLVNFLVVPVAFQPLYVNVFLLIWTPMLSMLGHGELWKRKPGD
jgi:hypothetical protein